MIAGIFSVGSGLGNEVQAWTLCLVPWEALGTPALQAPRSAFGGGGPLARMTGEASGVKEHNECLGSFLLRGSTQVCPSSHQQLSEALTRVNSS